MLARQEQPMLVVTGDLVKRRQWVEVRMNRVLLPGHQSYGMTSDELITMSSHPHIEAQ